MKINSITENDGYIKLIRFILEQYSKIKICYGIKLSQW